MPDQQKLVTEDATLPLRRLTRARVGLGRAGASLPVREWLAFKGAHAAARDTVHLPFHVTEMKEAIEALGQETITCNSAAQDRATYLLRPDLGRRLEVASREQLVDRFADAEPCDLAICVCDGLSTEAVHAGAQPVLANLLPRLIETAWRIAPIFIVRNGRVAIQDEIGQLSNATIALSLLGERPGLATATSLGAYFVHTPTTGKTDADRNCISNIHVDGLQYEHAAEAIYRLLTEIRSQQTSGVLLKAPDVAIEAGATTDGGLLE